MHAYQWNGILPWKYGLEMCSFHHLSVVSLPCGLVMACIQCVSVLGHPLLCCGSAECCGGPVMACSGAVFI